ncbi:MAG: ribosome silencing factor [Candidatus Bipolaricaulaceae bacterium]
MSGPEDRLVREAARLVEEKKAGRLVVLDLRETTIPTSYFLIAEGENRVHVRAIAQELLDKLPLAPLHEEGRGEGQWVLLDYGDFVVHLFDRDVREFYDLEGLWPDRTVLGL